MDAGPALAPACVALLGLGSGAFFSLALTFFLLRAANADHTAALSGMAQSAGYAIAATGPAALGFLHDATSSWTVPLVALLAISAAAVVAGLGAGKDREIDYAPTAQIG